MPLGNLPFIITPNKDMPHRDRHQAIGITILTAAMVGLGFLFAGNLF